LAPAAAAKDKVDEVAPASPSDAASGVKEAVSGAKDALLDSAADVVPDKATEAVDRAANSNPFSGLFGGEPLSEGRIATGVARTRLSVCARVAGAKDKVDEVAPSSASDAVQGVKEAVGGAKDAAQDAAPKAADSNPFSGLFGGDRSPLLVNWSGRHALFWQAG